MAVPLENATVSYDGNGVATEFPVPFKFLENSHLVVYTAPSDDLENFTYLTLDVDFTVDGAGEDAGGTITLATALASDVVLTIYRYTQFTQVADFTAQGTFPVSRHEDAYDKLTLMCQELKRRLEALENVAGGFINITDTAFTGSRITTDFTTDADAVENTFPLTVTCTSGSTAVDAWVTRLQNLDDTTELFDEKPGIQWKPGTGNTIVLLGVDGLKPDTNYRIRLIVLQP